MTLCASRIAVAACAVLMAWSTARGETKPNIIYLLADDLGFTDVGFHDSTIRTPNIDRLASEGVKLEQFYVQPVCSPTRASLMTGRYPMRYGLQTSVVRPWAQYGLPLEEPMLPQILKEAGYETAISGKWHLGHFERDYLPTRRGFEHQYGHYNGALDYFTHIRDEGLDWHRDDKVNRDEGYTTVLIGDEAVKRINERDKQRPLFLYVPFNAPHSPMQALPKDLAKYASEEKKVRQQYSAMVSCLDDQVGKIVAAIDQQGLRENTLILFSSDNGGPLGLGATNHGLRAGKGTVYEGGVRVCACANWKGKLKAGTVVNEPIHAVDILPTLVRLAGAKITSTLPLDGFDVWPTIAEGRPTPHQELLHNASPSGGALRVGDFKIVVNGMHASTAEDDLPEVRKRRGKKRGGDDDLVELFNIAEDRAEKTNLASSMPEKVKELQARYDQYLEESAPPKSEPMIKDFKSPAVWGEPDAK